MLLLGALLGGRLLRGRPVRGPVRLGRVAYSTRLRTSWRPASWRRASWRRVFAWRRPWLMCLRYLARGRERGGESVGRRFASRGASRPGTSAARKPPAAPGSPRPTGAQTQRSSNWPDDPAARRGGRANQGSAVRAVSPISVGATAHVIAGNCGVVRRSEPRNPRADCVLGHGVATAVCVMVFCRVSWRPLEAAALRLLEQVQGNLDAVRAVYGGTGNARLCLAFCAIFLLPQFRGVRSPRTRSNTP